MKSVSVSSCRCMFLSCVHPVAVLNAAFSMTCSLLMLIEDAIGDHTEEAYSRAGLITALYVATSVSFCLPHPRNTYNHTYISFCLDKTKQPSY